MPTRNVVITEHQAALIERLVASGRYQNASEVLREGLRLVERQDAEHAARLAAFHVALDEGERDIREGRVTELGDAAEIRALISRLRPPRRA
ncbi:type II toxin-antitoxin system ParD family antitoxin [Falsiroseomonas oryzae]|uniref:type II toxin-antitoxin system ParD family antitoxin n=1 Tax=Falsiroseomonas oryzae TaxID=2766473 RepID=UPI0022EA364E|nr:type II toxin-antitoxin system ParD family antitoxin [Roseomonas sp. MO-31]